MEPRDGLQRMLQVGVKILIRNRRGQILLLHRSAKKYPEVFGFSTASVADEGSRKWEGGRGNGSFPVEERRAKTVENREVLKPKPQSGFGVWDIPGGRIEAGSVLLDNLRREVREETGLTVLGTPTLLAAQDIIRSDKHVVRLTYLGSARGKIKLDEEENDKYEWVSVSDARRLKDVDKYLKAVILKARF